MELENESKFDVKEDQLEFTTMSNGDRIRIHGIHLTPESAAALAHMVNGGHVLEVEIKAKGT